MRIHYIQHGLSDLHTHYFSDTLAWKDAIDHNGAQWFGYANERLAPDVARMLDLRTVFPFPPDACIDPDTVSREFTDLLFLSDAFANACRAVSQAGVSQDDLVVIPYATNRDIYGVARWFQTMSAAARPRVAFIFHAPDFGWQVTEDRGTITGVFSSWRFAANQLLGVLPVERVMFGALDDRLCQFLSNVLAAPVTSMPMVSFFEKQAVQQSVGAKHHDILVAGEFRAEKGVSLWSGVVGELSTRLPELRYSIQVPDQAHATAVKSVFANCGIEHRCQLAIGQLSHRAYSERMAQSRLLVLPFEPWRYAIRGSATCSEAFGFGLPVVVPARTWMSDRLEQGAGAGVTFDQWRADRVAQAVVETWAQIDSLTELARERAPAWRVAHGARAALAIILNTLGLAL
jgi:glycosyltransferase involved in cell wall biosynthesis